MLLPCRRTIIQASINAFLGKGKSQLAPRFLWMLATAQAVPYPLFRIAVSSK